MLNFEEKNSHDMALIIIQKIEQRGYKCDRLDEVFSPVTCISTTTEKFGDGKALKITFGRALTGIIIRIYVENWIQNTKILFAISQKWTDERIDKKLEEGKI